MSTGNPEDLEGPLLNILRRASLTRLLLLCGLVVAIGASATAIAFALGTGPTPPPKPLADAVHDALAAPPVDGVSANIELTNHLLEGANLASGSGEGGELTSSPLLAGGSGRLWIAKDGDVRLELQAEGGDTQVLYDGHTISIYDAASNTLYRYTPPADGASAAEANTGHPEAPSVAKIEEEIAHLSQHANVSGATPTDVGGRPAYTVRVSPKESGSLLGGAELSFDAGSGVPLRAAVYSSTSPSPVVELAASDISYGPVASSVFELTPPASAKVEEIKPRETTPGNGDGEATRPKPKITAHGHGPSTILVLEQKTGSASQAPPEGVPQVKINGVSASELSTELGTVLSFERSGVRYFVGGSVTPAAIEALARGL